MGAGKRTEDPAAQKGMGRDYREGFERRVYRTGRVFTGENPIEPQDASKCMESERRHMTFDEYQRQAAMTAMYPDVGNNYIYPALGLCGEAGEVAEKIKKVIRDSNGVVSANAKREIEKEMGDVLWYLARLCSEIGLSMDSVALLNLKKLFPRKERGLIKGNGDNR